MAPHPTPTEAPDHALAGLTDEDVLADLLAGRSLPLELPAPLAPHRPAFGGPASLAAVVAARVAGALRLPVADRALDHLWFTPWTIGRARPRPEGAHTLRLPFRGTHLAGWELGTGPTVLLVHGWGGRSTDLGRIAGRLAAAGMRAVAVDLPAHGASPGTTTDVLEMAAAVGEVGRHLAPLHGVVAHSLGSVASMLAAADGLDVGRLVLIAPPSALEHAVARQVQRARLSRATTARLRRRIEARFGPDVWRVLDVADTAERVHPDVLVVHDADDQEVPVAEGARVAAAFGTRPVVTSGLGHGRVLADDTVVSHVLGHLGAAVAMAG